MLTGKQRSYLRALANSVEPIIQIGKGGVTDGVLKQIDDALNARELVKVSILQNSMLDAKTFANETAKALGAEYVQSIGSKFVLYRESKEKIINIPK
jgi:RNA-binding protein